MSKNPDNKPNYSTIRKYLLDLEYNAKFLRRRIYFTRFTSSDLRNLEQIIDNIKKEKSKENDTE